MQQGVAHDRRMGYVVWRCWTHLRPLLSSPRFHYGEVIAALYVEKNGGYYGLKDVDPWDKDRDARLYAGPWPVVAHPPCDRWCQMAPVNQARYGHRIGDDGGCFASALSSVRT